MPQLASVFERTRHTFDKMILPIVVMLIRYYVIAIIQALLTAVFYSLAPLVYVCGGSCLEWNDILYELHERFMIFLGFQFNRTKLKFYGDFNDTPSTDKNLIVICNHQAESDYLLMAAALDKANCLKRMRHVMKEVLIWIPYAGPFLISHGSLFINRRKTDWRRFDRNCQKLLDSNVPWSILIYPEGTTWNNALDYPELFKKSAELAEKNNEAPFTHVIYPKHRGLHRILTNVGAEVDAIYDFTFAYSSVRNENCGREPSPSIIGFFDGCCETVHIHLTRIDAAEIPRGEDDLQNFLVRRYRRKDELLEEFFQNGKFLQEGCVQPFMERSHIFQSWCLFIFAIFLGFWLLSNGIFFEVMLSICLLGYVHAFVYRFVT